LTDRTSTGAAPQHQAGTIGQQQRERDAQNRLTLTGAALVGVLFLGWNYGCDRRLGHWAYSQWENIVVAVLFFDLMAWGFAGFPGIPRDWLNDDWRR
jgi:hypothetical protein